MPLYESTGVKASRSCAVGRNAGGMKESRSNASTLIGQRVWGLRTRAALSRNRLAAMAGLDVSHLARIETGKGNPTLFVLIQLATALEVSPAFFVEGMSADDLPEDIRPYTDAEYRAMLQQLGRRPGR